MDQRRLVLCAGLGIAAIVGCKNNSTEPGPTGAAAATPGEPAAEVSRRTQLTSYRPLLDEVGRAELDVGGVLIDLGSPDQHKYTRGGWRTGWGESKAGEHETWSSLQARSGYLELPAPASAPKEIVLRARSKVAKQRVTLFVSGRELGTVDVDSAWSERRVAIPDGAMPVRGRVRIELRTAAGSNDASRAEVDWVWLARGAEVPAITPRVLSLDIAGTARRSLATPTARSYAFYLEPPPQAELVVDLGAAERTRFTITAVTDDGERTELANELVERAWREHVVPLAKLAGKAVRLELTTSEQRGAAGWGEPELMIAAAQSAPVAQGGKRPKNIIFLVMDTARADAFGPFAKPDRVVKTPHFDALAARSTVFTAAYNNENWTKPSVATSLSGLYPTTHDAKQDADKLSNEVELISEHLKQAGYATAGFVANGYVSNAFGFEQGWNVFRNYIRENKSSEAEHVFEDALAWHAKHVAKHPEQPFLLYLQTIDPHVTYRVDREYWAPYFSGTYDGPLGPSIDAEDQVALSNGKLKPHQRDVQWLTALYFGEIAYHDAQLGKLIAELEARHVLDDTLLVITNDHGEELGERGRFGHGHQVFEEMIRAPLVIHYPPLFKAGAVIPDIVEHVDLAPTILDALGKEPLAAADGISFLPLARGLPVQQPHYAMTEFLQSRRVLRVGHWKLFGKPGTGGALFDLAADPKEQRDLGDAALVARQLCEILLGEALAIPDKAERLVGIASRRRFQAGEAKISPQMRRQLEALGYLGADPKAAPSGTKSSDEE